MPKSAISIYYRPYIRWEDAQIIANGLKIAMTEAPSEDAQEVLYEWWQKIEIAIQNHQSRAWLLEQEKEYIKEIREREQAVIRLRPPDDPVSKEAAEKLKRIIKPSD